jgi:DNA-binding response OmpR family regulator
MNKILLVEDDQSLGYILKEYLQMNDYEVAWQQDGEAGLNAFKASRFDICILDVMIPKIDGFELASEIKKINKAVPVVFLTAKSLKIDKLKGFKTGCDDYITKPVDEEELIARIGAILRRSNPEPLAVSDNYKIGTYTFCTSKQQLKRNDNIAQLTEKESKILTMLCLKKGELVERDRILKALWGESDYFKRRSMDVFIYKIRKHLSDDPSIKISNIHSKGFILED